MFTGSCHADSWGDMTASSNSTLEGWVGIVDDDDSIRRSLARVFRINGITARTFASAEEFLSFCCDEDEPLCLVLDVQLGGMSGFELKDRLHANGRTAPIIFITALEEIPSAELEGRSSSHGYLRKPFDTAALLALVGELAHPSAAA
jgi:FixJ family two-component response regulator